MTRPPARITLPAMYYGLHEYADFYEKCALDRIWFAKQVLQFIPDPWQADILFDLDTGETRLSAVSGHGTGKSAVCAITAIHFLLFRQGSTKIAITSPSGAQMETALRAEIILWIGKLPMFLRQQLEVRQKSIVRLDMPDNAFIAFRTARIEQPEALAGIHAENVMVIVDEASGVPQPIWEAASGTLSTEGAIWLLISNPTRTSGFFYTTQTKLRDLWKCYHISSIDSDRVSTNFIETIRRTYGENSAQYKIRVLGEFHDQDEDVIIPRTLAKSAIGRDIHPDGDIVWGVDPGRTGDASGFVCRHGGVVTHIRELFLSDLMALVGQIHQHWEDTAPAQKPKHVFVDSIGLGAGVADRLRELGLPVVDVNVSETPALKDRFPRMRDELWFNSRDWFETRRVSIPKTPIGEELVEELVTPLMQITSAGKNAAESKKEMKRRGAKSPNLADALNLTFAYGAAAASGRSKGSSWGKPVSRGLQSVC